MKELKDNINTKRSILIIYTGGTIGMLESPDTGLLRPLDFTYLEEELPELKKLDCQSTVFELSSPIDSSSISLATWYEIAEIIENNYTSYDGFVVLHGTDTMSYTASALSFMLDNLAKPIIFTGSQLPIGKLRTDGKENLITAIEIASAQNEDGSPRIQEVCILFNNHLMRGNRTSKVSADQFKAFKSYNYPELATVGINIRYNDAYIKEQKSSKKLKVYKSLDPHVLILKIFPGITQDVVESMLAIKGLKGVILESFGSGNAPMMPWFINAIKNAIDKGVTFMNVTQCDSGRVDMLRYETGQILHNIGVISGYDITTEAALAKMMFLLDQNQDYNELRRKLSIPLRGECSITPSLK